VIFSILLTLAFIFLGLYTLAFLSNRLLGRLLLVLYAGALFVLWQPDASTRIANIIGIGRGVDFGLMLVSVISLNLIVFLIHHVHQLHKQITLITRHLAIRDAITPQASADRVAEGGLGDNQPNADLSGLAGRQ
jgi:small membrane protein